MDLLHEEKEPIEWRSLHVGAEREVDCEHMQALLTNIYCRDIGEWQEDRWTDLEPVFFCKYNGSACFENCETEFRYWRGWCGGSRVVWPNMCW